MARRNKSTKRNIKQLRQGPTRKEEMKEIASDHREAKRYSNDPAWYATTPALLMDAASIPFSQSVGTGFNYCGETVYIPGIMTFDLVPVIGDEGAPNSPINIASTAMYSFVRHANSGSANYDSPDLMQYVMAVAQVYSYINFLQRAYGTITLYSHSNRYLPMGLVRAMCLDFDDLQSSLANFRYAINVLIHKAASLACPADMTYFRRLAFLFSGIYSEGESVKSQLYMYNPIGFLVYNEATDAAPTLTLKRLRTFGTDTLLTVQDLINYGNDLINPLLSSESINIMSGDILKAYGANILKLTPLGDIYTVIPVTDLTVLEQMQNLDVLRDNASNVYSVVQRNSDVASGPYLASTVLVSINDRYQDAYTQHVLTTILTQPTAADVIERTRGMVTVETPASTTQSLARVRSGSEVCVGMKYWVVNGNTLTFLGQDVPQCNYSVYVGSFPSLTAEQQSAMYNTVANQVVYHRQFENFKFHPKLMYFKGNDNYIQTSADFQGFALDFDNYAVISQTDLNRMNEAALLALFNVPSIARF